MRAQDLDLRFMQAFVPREFYDINGKLNATLDAKGTQYASTLTVVLLVLLAGLALVQFQMVERRVHYR